MTDTATPAATADLDVTPGTQLTVQERASLALASTETEEHLKALAIKHKSITVIKDKAGRDQAHGAAMELLKARTAIEGVSKTSREDATKFTKAVIAEEKRLIAITQEEEKRLFAVRDVWDEEQERIRQEKVLAEQRRVEAINAEISDIANVSLKFAGAASAAIDAEISYWQLREVEESVFQEFTDKAKYTLSKTVSELQALRDIAIAREVEAAKLVAEREEIERVRAEQAALAADLARQVRELQEANARAAAELAASTQRALDEANAKSKREAEQRAEFVRKQEDAFAAEKAEAQAKIDAQQRQINEQMAAIQKEQNEKAAAEAAVKAKLELDERNALLAKQEAERQARNEEAMSFASRVVAVVAEAFEIDPEEAEEYIQRAAETLNAQVAA